MWLASTRRKRKDEDDVETFHQCPHNLFIFLFFSIKLISLFFCQIPMETAPSSCHARAECSDVPRANVYHHCGCAIIKRTARRARMNFSHVLRPTVKMDNSVAANTYSIRHIVYRPIINVIWLWIALMEVMNPSAVSWFVGLGVLSWGPQKFQQNLIFWTFFEAWTQDTSHFLRPKKLLNLTI